MADTMKRERSGWVVVSALLLVMTVCHGVITSGLPALDTTLLESLDISRADLKLRESIFLMASGLSGLGIGFLTARVAPRTIVLSGLALLAIALALYGHAQTIGQIYLLYALLGMCYASAHVVIVVLMVRQCFNEKRALAISVALSGTSIGSAIFPSLIVLALEQYDWRQVLTGLAVLPLLLLPIVAFLLPRLRVGETLNPAPPVPVQLVTQYRRSPVVVALLLVAIFATFFSSTAFLLNLFLYLQDIGLSARLTATGVSTVFVVGLVGKVLVGIAAERWGVHAVWTSQQCVLLAGAAILSLAMPSIVFAGLILLGLGWAGCYVLTQVVISEVFAGPNLGRIAGGFIVFEAIASGSGVWIAASAADRFGSYQMAFILCCGLLIVSILATLAFRRIAIIRDDGVVAG
ncbi:MFS transporter [Sphingopyxis sp. JAI108]|uniref:MFS transporter n=1 Tax=Sphingopyxis sp. JAI108 TaxID=2723060 RepID=UPI0015CE657E|nr:MFS transporter [Sphingopyxis sp. JAI108]NYF33976.1 MFS family permease [Sphingopyxis sp. JAI108]